MSDINYVTDSSNEDSSLEGIDLDSSFGDDGSDTSHDTDASDALVCEGMDEPNYISADHCYYPDISRWQVRWHEYPEPDDEECEPLVPSMDQWSYGCSPMCSKEEVAEFRQHSAEIRAKLYGHGTRSQDGSDDSDDDVKPLKTEK
jgi:hypothetical protein